MLELKIKYINSKIKYTDSRPPSTVVVFRKNHCVESHILPALHVGEKLHKAH